MPGITQLACIITVLLMLVSSRKRNNPVVPNFGFLKCDTATQFASVSLMLKDNIIPLVSTKSVLVIASDLPIVGLSMANFQDINT